MTDTDPDVSITIPQRWDRWPTLLMERIRLPYPWVIVLMALLGAISVALDTAFRYRLNGVWPSRNVAVGVSSVVVSVYILAYVRLIKRSIGPGVGAVETLRADQRCGVRELRSPLPARPGRRGNTSLGPGGGDADRVSGAAARPASGLPRQHMVEVVGLVVIAWYWTLMFYLLLSLVYISVRNARALGGLARRPLVVNVFDRMGFCPSAGLAWCRAWRSWGCLSPAGHPRAAHDRGGRLARDWPLGPEPAGPFRAAVGRASTDRQVSRPRPGEPLR